ncbi:hypothetical protein C1I63_18500 [Rathayibacter caricis DSM 15933]|uniref:Uncharacterized protein n=1 Tax=Rathayibacter caricis DSM 15933 TaxID=1328867 RepID=A0A2T4UNZ4_9MICO|nr:hypothetical protein [Rathayibacter caricis]PTL71231.1 hypothetical protein C1I63_18500 [Rathayibacter caricis DSM 15933]
MKDLREVAAPPWEEDLLVAAEFHGAVGVWSLAHAARCAEFDTMYDFGGRRVALVPGEHPVVVVGAYERHGVSGYDLTGERLWQDRSRTNVQIVTALAGGLVAVSYNRSTTRVLAAATGHEVRSLRGVRRVFALRPDTSLGVGSDWCRLLDRSLDPLGPRIPVPSAALVSAASDGDHLVIAEVGGPLRIIDSSGRERARLADHFRHVVHDPATDTWVLIHETSEGQYSLLRLTHDAEVLEQRPCAPVHDVATMRGGRTLALLTGKEVQLMDCSDWSVQTLDTLTPQG